MTVLVSPALDAALDRLARLHPKRIDLSLARMRRVLAALDHPEKRLPPVVHVAGTNGKGSVVAYVRASLEAAGYRVHVYTSPHLMVFNERIRLAGKLIGDELLIDCLTTVEQANGGEALTFFEATSAAAFVAFARTPADALVMEVGLGGRLDATNVIDAPVSTIVTRVAIDHQEFLGRSLAAIAAEKAGIAKRDVPFVTAQPDKAVTDVLVKTARAAGARPIIASEHWRAASDGKMLNYEDARGKVALPLPKLAGAFQAENAALALAALRHQRQWKLPVSALKAGLGWANWPARLQRLAKGPLPALMPPGSVLWLDGGHNPAAGQVLAREFKSLLPPERALFLVVGMMATKDASGFLKPFVGQARAVHTVAIEGEACHPPAAIAAAASALGIPGRPAASVGAALKAIAEEGSRPPPVVLITGSLYLAGQVLAANGWTPH
ncbi:MAG: bifunctional folylpolyglutamate synthase/dihydrofolate synthase [Pseudomonadota bacterium]